MDIHIESLEFKYNHNEILTDLNLDIEKGQFVGVIGPNGAGKTTLLKLLEKLLKPHRGLITFGNKDLKKFSHNEIARNIGYIPQYHGSNFPLTVFNTILMGRKPYFSSAPKKDDLKVVSEIIKQMGLSDLSLRNIHEMSGGQRQKVFFGRVLAQNPEVLLLDEPTANLDLKHQLEILALLADISGKESKTVIMAIHDMNLALKFCDHFIMLHNHKIFARGGMEIMTADNIEHVFDVKVSVHRGKNNSKFIIPESTSVLASKKI